MLSTGTNEEQAQSRERNYRKWSRTLKPQNLLLGTYFLQQACTSQTIQTAPPTRKQEFKCSTCWGSSDSNHYTVRKKKKWRSHLNPSYLRTRDVNNRSFLMLSWQSGHSKINACFCHFPHYCLQNQEIALNGYSFEVHCPYFTLRKASSGILLRFGKMLTSMHPSIFTKLICASQLEQNEA